MDVPCLKFSWNCFHATTAYLWLMQLLRPIRIPFLPVACFQSLKPIMVDVDSGLLLKLAPCEPNKQHG